MNKKLVALILVTVTLVTVCVCACICLASERLNSEIANILNKQMTQEEYDILLKESYYDHSISRNTFEDAYFLKTYGMDWGLAGEEFEVFLEKARHNDNKEKNSRYDVFGSDLFKLAIIETEEGKITIGKALEYKDNIPTFVNDIIKLSDIITFDKNDYHLEDIYCFSRRTTRTETVLYFKTDKGLLVKYYEDEKTEGVLFYEEDFRKKAEAYNKYITSYEYNHNKHGEFTGGYDVSFGDFLRDNPITSNLKIKNVLLIVSITILVLGVILIIVIRKKKKGYNVPRKQDGNHI